MTMPFAVFAWTANAQTPTSFYSAISVILPCIRNAMVYLTSPRVNGFAGDVYKAHPDPWNAVFVPIAEELSNKRTMDAGLTSCVAFGFPKSGSLIQSFLNLSTALTIFLRHVGN